MKGANRAGWVVALVVVALTGTVSADLAVAKASPATEVSPIGPEGITLGEITAGPDRNLWFSTQSDLGDTTVGGIGRITPAGVVTLFSAGLTSTPLDIVTAADKNLWFPEVTANLIGRITPHRHDHRVPGRRH